jgi:hypothetical protein
MNILDRLIAKPVSEFPNLNAPSSGGVINLPPILPVIITDLLGDEIIRFDYRGHKSEICQSAQMKVLGTYLLIYACATRKLRVRDAKYRVGDMIIDGHRVPNYSLPKSKDFVRSMLADLVEGSEHGTKNESGVRKLQEAANKVFKKSGPGEIFLRKAQDKAIEPLTRLFHKGVRSADEGMRKLLGLPPRQEKNDTVAVPLAPDPDQEGRFIPRRIRLDDLQIF